MSLELTKHSKYNYTFGFKGENATLGNVVVCHLDPKDIEFAAYILPHVFDDICNITIKTHKIDPTVTILKSITKSKKIVDECKKAFISTQTIRI